MDNNTIGALIYFGVAIVVAIISATIMRVKRVDECELDRFDIGDAFISVLLGWVWPITIFAGVAYLASGFLCRIINAKKGN